MIAQQNKAKSKPKHPNWGKFAKVCGIVTAPLVIITAVVVFVIANSDEEVEKPKSDKKSTTIAEYKARMAAKVESVTGRKFEPIVVEKPEEPLDLGFYTNKMGEVKRRTGKKIILVSPKRKKLFTNHAEEQLSGVVNTALGANFYDYDVPADFEEQFLHSLTNQIEIAEDDTDEEANEKQRVIDAKETLRQAWERGDDLVELMKVEKQNMREKFESYITFEQGLNQMRAAGADADELAEYALAAKMMMQQLDIEHPLALGINEAEAMKRLEKIINYDNNEEEVDEEDIDE